MSTQHDGVDADIATLYRANEGQVDVHAFAANLVAHLPSARRRPGRGRVAHRLILAGAALVLLAAVGVGTWQGLERIGGPETELILGDATETTELQLGSPQPSRSDEEAWTSGAGWTLPRYSIEASARLAELDLLAVWRDAAAHFAIDPSTARIDQLSVCWDTASLSDFMLTASTPDGRAISVFTTTQQGWTSATASGDPSRLRFDASIAPFAEQGFTGAEASAASVMVYEVLQEIDSMTLLGLGEQSGVQIAGDPEELWQAHVDCGALGVDPASYGPALMVDENGQIVESDEVIGAVRWRLSCDSWSQSLFLSGDQLLETRQWYVQMPSLLSLAEGRLTVLADDGLDSSLFPVARLELQREWVTVDPVTREPRGGMVSGPEAWVLVHSRSSEGAGSLVEASSVDARLDGLAYATGGGSICRISGGAALTMWSVDARYCSFGTASYGASYSTGRSLLLSAGTIAEVTSSSSAEPFEVLQGRSQVGSGGGSGSDSGGETWEVRSTSEAALIAVPSTGGAPSELLRDARIPLMSRVRYDESTDSLVFAAFVPDLGPTKLYRAEPHAADLERVALAGEFGGDFAMSRDGSTLLYIGVWQVPMRVNLLTADTDREVQLTLATAYSPVFSPDGTTVCLVGSERLDGPSSLWLYDVATGDCRKLESTEGLTPTYPAFSSDGQRIAFRNWILGDIWTVALDGTGLTRYDLPTADAPIAW